MVRCTIRQLSGLYRRALQVGPAAHRHLCAVILVVFFIFVVAEPRVLERRPLKQVLEVGATSAPVEWYASPPFLTS